MHPVFEVIRHSPVEDPADVEPPEEAGAVVRGPCTFGLLGGLQGSAKPVRPEVSQRRAEHLVPRSRVPVVIRRETREPGPDMGIDTKRR